jgi:hypothetical protein
MAIDPTDRIEILAVRDRYATAMERHDWSLPDPVFTRDFTYDAGEWVMENRQDSVKADKHHKGLASASRNPAPKNRKVGASRARRTFSNRVM